MLPSGFRVVIILPLLCCCFFFINNALADGNKAGSREPDDSTLTSPNHEASYTLDDLVVIGLKHNPALKAVRQRIEQRRGQLTQARAGYLPNLTLTGRYSYNEREDSGSEESGQNLSENSNVSSEDLEIVEGDETEKGDVLQGTVSLTQLIYDFGKTGGAIDAERANVRASDAQLQRQIQDLIFKVKEAYYDVLEKKRLIDVAQEAVKSFQQHQDRARLYLKAGVRTKIDVINAEVELSNAHMSLLRSNYDLKISRVKLEQVLGSKPNHGKYVLQQDDIQLDTLLDSMPPLPDDLDRLINVAMLKRPDVVEQQLLFIGAEERLQSVRGNYWPVITAEASYSDYETDITQYEDNWDVGVAARWELFSGLRTKGEAVEALGGKLESKAHLEELELAVVREVTESFLQADENRQGVEIALKTLGLAQQNVDLAEKRYKTGANDVLEFNDAQLRLTSARSDLVVAYFNYLTALAAIEYSTGQVNSL